jgi:DNA-binding response OmpR family regulator
VKRILVVEDEPDMVELIRYNLEKEGFRVDAAADGEQALSKAPRVLPDLVLLDLMLPGLDGLEVMRRLRASREGAALPVILLTAKAGEADRVVGLELGADDYIVKPFSPRELVARIKAVLRRITRPLEEPPVLARGPIVIDAVKREVTVEGEAA